MATRWTYDEVFEFINRRNSVVAELLDRGCQLGFDVRTMLMRLKGLVQPNAEDNRAWQETLDGMIRKVEQMGAGLCKPAAQTTAMAQYDPNAAIIAAAAAAAGGGRAQNPGASSQFDPPDDMPDEHDHDGEHGGGGGACGIDGPCKGEGPCNGTCEGCSKRPKKPMPTGGNGPALPIPVVNVCNTYARWNCEAVDSDIGPCEFQRIRRTKRLWSVTGTTALGNVVVVANDAAHEIPAGMTAYAIEVPAIKVSHLACVRKVEVRGTPAGGGGLGVLIPGTEVWIEVEKIFFDGNGNIVHAWEYFKPEDPDYFTIKDGRCECAKLCDCVPARSRFRVIVLIPTQAIGTVISMTASGVRKCWRVACGPCPPGLICDRTPIAVTGCVCMAPTPAGLIAALKLQAAANPPGYDFSAVLEAAIADFEAGGVDPFTPQDMVVSLGVSATDTFSQAFLVAGLAANADLAWTPLLVATGLNAAGAGYDFDVVRELMGNSFLTGIEWADTLVDAPQAIRDAALTRYIANYAGYGYTAVQIAAAIVAAGGTLAADVKAALP